MSVNRLLYKPIAYLLVIIPYVGHLLLCFILGGFRSQSGMSMEALSSMWGSVYIALLPFIVYYVTLYLLFWRFFTESNKNNKSMMLRLVIIAALLLHVNIIAGFVVII